MFMKEKSYLNKWKFTLYIWIRRFSIKEILIFLKIIYKFNIILIRIFYYFFLEVR